ncbi:MAG: winged helix DNA-binding protein [Alphaproteobacteria bacterium]|nr:winged helix DNA-binding protein [Alphaproteobacteria bacterium]
MRPVYLETVALIERLYRHFLDVVKEELDRLGVDDINSVQCLILYNIGDDELTVGELTQRGCYMGTNVTYNMKKMIEAGYVTQQRSPRDRRSVRVRLSDDGMDLCRRLAEVFDRHSVRLAREMTEQELTEVNARLHCLEDFWSDVGSHTAAPVRRSRTAA